MAASAEEAGRAATELGFPVVVKTALAGVHKTETGGVVLDLQTEAEVREAASRIGGAVLVQPMRTGSAELLAGLVQDELFGPLVALGPGGVFAELIGDAGLRIAPLTDVDARELVLEGKTGALVRGYRGKPAADAEAPSSKSSTGCRRWVWTCRRSPSSTSIPCSPARTAASRSTRASPRARGRADAQPEDLVAARQPASSSSSPCARA